MSSSSDHISIPPEVYHGTQLHDKNIIKYVAANPNLQLPHSEEVRTQIRRAGAPHSNSSVVIDLIPCL
jgi:hypothetical protein